MDRKPAKRERLCVSGAHALNSIEPLPNLILIAPMTGDAANGGLSRSVPPNSRDAKFTGDRVFDHLLKVSECVYPAL
jgi:hypothetical protein